jgi:drug/metabolite transporter (DMT)-like permease
MEGWYLFAIVALLCMGTQRFFYKVSAERKCNTAWTTLAFMTTVAVMSAIVFLVRNESVANLPFLFFIAFVNSSAFLVATVSHIEALKYAPAAVVYPIIRLNIVVVVIFSILFFKDQLSIYQAIGVGLAIAVIFILTRQIEDKKSADQRSNRGLVFIFMALIAGVIATISSKFAVINTNKIAFMAVSYAISTIYAFGLRNKLQTDEASTNLKEALFIGLAMGVINFAGYYSFLKAIFMGPLSITVSIVGMHFVIAIILSAWVFKEKLTSMKIIGILLTVFSVILMRL